MSVIPGWAHEKLRKLRDFYDYNSTAGEMEGGRWETECAADLEITIAVSLRKSVLDQLRAEARGRDVRVSALVRSLCERHVGDTS